MKAWRAMEVVLVVVGVLVLLGSIAFGSQGCNHTWTPAEERLVDTGTSAVTECLAQPLVQCMWGAGATGYKVCLRNAVVPCLVERAQEAAGAGLAVLWERYSVRLHGVDPGAAGDVRGGEVMRCIDAIDAPLVADQCPEGKAPRLCVVDAVRWCGERGEEAGCREWGHHANRTGPRAELYSNISPSRVMRSAGRGL